MAKDTNWIGKTSWVLSAVGAVNWGLVGALNFNAVAILGATPAKIVYILVGIAGLISLWNLFSKLNK